MYQMKLCEYYSPIFPGFVYKFCSGMFGWDEELNMTTSFEISDCGLSAGDRLSCLENNFIKLTFFLFSLPMLLPHLYHALKQDNNAAII